jgi:hypothetical protein
MLGSEAWTESNSPQFPTGPFLSDIKATVACVNRQGSPRSVSLQKISHRDFQVAKRKSVQFSARYSPTSKALLPKQLFLPSPKLFQTVQGERTTCSSRIFSDIRAFHLKILIGEEAMDLVLKAFRPSSTRQYQSQWKTFQVPISKKVHEISFRTIFAFLTFLFKEKNLSPKSILVYRNALKLPIEQVFILDFNNPLLLRRVCLNPGLLELTFSPQWDLFIALEFSKFPVSLSNKEKVQRASCSF